MHAARKKNFATGMMPAPHPSLDQVEDIRFRQLLGTKQWNDLPAAVRLRFSKRLTGTAIHTYVGKVVGARATWLGKLIAQFARVIGAPLPLDMDINTPAVVTVCEEPETGGQLWTRVYGRKTGFPQVIQSAKRFEGPTGLEEYIGYGVGMALIVDTDNGSMRFRSDHFFLRILGRRVRIPRILFPITVTVRHIDQRQGKFIFELDLSNRRPGLILHQAGLFEDKSAGTVLK